MKILSKIKPINGADFKIADVEDIAYADIDLKQEVDSKTYHISNVANMKLKDFKINDCVITTGYYQPNDGGRAMYIITDNPQDGNDGDIIKLKNGLSAELLPSGGEINVAQFGAYRGQTSKDSSNAFQNAINFVYNEYKKGNSYVIVVDGGTYRIDKQLVLNYYTRLKSNGLVKMWFYNTGNAGLYFKHVPSLGKYSNFSYQGFQQSYLIDGSVGGFSLCGTQRDVEGGQIGIDYGSNDKYENGVVGALLKNGMFGVEFSNFSIGMRINTCHNYLMHFENLGFRNCYVGVQFGDEDNTELYDSGENITFDKCTWGGNGSAIKGYSYMIFKVFRSSFDMNNCAIECLDKGGIINISNCWLERNGLTSFQDYQKGSYGIFVKSGTNTKLNLELIDSYITYGGDDEGKQLTDNLIRGNIFLKLRNLRAVFGTDFYTGEKKRLFLCKNDVIVRDKGEFNCNSMLLHEYACDNYNNMFQNISTGSLLPISPNQTTIGDFTVDKYYTLKTVECLENNPLSTGGKTLHFTANNNGGAIGFISKDFIPLGVGKTIRPAVIFNKANSTKCGVSIKVLVYDSNKKQIATMTGDYIKQGEEFYYYPMTITNSIMPQNAMYYKIRFEVYFNEGVGDIYVKGIYTFTY